MKKLLSVLLAVLLALSVVALGEEMENFREGDFEYRLLDDGTAEIARYCGDAADQEIPSELGGVTVTAIGNGAFSYCRWLTSVTIPDSVTIVVGNPFTECEMLTQIVVSPDHPALEIVDGALFSKAEKRMICFPHALEETAYEIPRGTTTISDLAFSSNASLTSVIIPDSVTTVGRNPFMECRNLAQIVVSPDNPVLETVDGALVSKADKQLICYPRDQEQTTCEIPQGTVSIGDGAFYGCDSLTSIDIPDSVTTIGNMAFLGCISLASIDIPDSVTTIGGMAFFGCISFTSVIIPDSMTTISDAAFAYCESLEYVVIPNGVTAISDAAFAYCESLTSVTIPDGVTIIGKWAFIDCDSLTSVAIPDSVTAIGDGAFDGCKNLTLIVGRDSYAKEYAETNGLAYTYPDANDWLNS